MSIELMDLDDIESLNSQSILKTVTSSPKRPISISQKDIAIGILCSN